MKTINAQTTTEKLAIVDPRVAAYEILVADIQDQTKVIIIDPNFDGIEQITAALTEYRVSSLHIVCHGAPGCLYLGKTPIHGANIQQYRHQLQQWQVQDILLYACNVAEDTPPQPLPETERGFPALPSLTERDTPPQPLPETERGLKPLSCTPFPRREGGWGVRFSDSPTASLISEQSLSATENPNTHLLEQLHHLTGANIAASKHPVGNRGKGGTWNLERKLGNITSPLAFSPEICSSYPGIFSVTFATATNFAVGNNPNSVAIGDFNGDGKSDLAVANQSFNNVSILTGTGTGSFNTATNFSVGTSPLSVAIGDFNGDGKSDIAVANLSSNNVSILTGTGTGSFNTATNFSVGTVPVSVAIGDFNGDGKSDLAVANRESNNVSILTGTGTGSFNTPTNFSVGTRPFSVAIGDFNGDGKSDIAVANLYSNNVSILIGTGTGSFNTATNFSVGTVPVSVAISDFNGDGKSDLAVANRDSNNVSILIGTGTGSFNTPTNFSVGSFPLSVAIGDFNGDGKSDIAVANLFSNNVSILTGTGTGSFNTATNFSVGTNPHSVAISDFNGDGKSDIAVANFGYNTISVLLNTTIPPLPTVTITAGTNPSESGSTNGTFTITLNNPAPAGGLTVNFALAGTATNSTDYSITAGNNITNVTGSSFAIAAGATSATLQVTPVDDTVVDPSETVQLTLNNGSGYNVGAANNASVTIADNDPVISMTAGTAPSESGPTNGVFNLSLNAASPTPITVSFNTTGSTATATTDYTFDLAASTGITAIAANSFTIAAGVTSASLVVKPVDDALIETGGETVQLNLLSGTGYTLNNATTTTTNFSVGIGPISVAIGDLNGDGISDLAVANYNSNNVSILTGTGSGSFNTATNFSVGNRPVSVAVADFNGDGKSDLAVVNRSANNVSILTGTGTGSFNTPTNFSVGIGPFSVAIGDFNGDGKSDLAVANFNSSNISILTGTGTGSFNTPTNFSVGFGPRSVAIGDFNGDGKSDIAVANANSNNVSILINDGTGSFNTATNFAVGADPVSVAIGDFNGDGKSDIAVANRVSNNVSIRTGTGTGSFNPATNFSVGTIPYSVAIGDFNGDGKSDIAVANLYSSTVSILTGTGTGSFNTATNFSVGDRPSSVAIGDFNGDGKSDLAVANRYSNNVSVLLNQQILSATQTIADNDPVRVQFSAPTYQINEDGTTVAAVTINRIGDALSPGSVQVQLTNGTATGGTQPFAAGTDFNNTTQTINFASGETSKTVTIPINDDNLVEGNENLTLTLVNPSPNFVLGTQTTATVTIVDNDTDVTLAISPSSVTEDGATNLVYTFTRNGVTTTPLTVNFNVSGTATYNTDYTVTGANTFNGSTGTVTFAANSTTATVTIDPTADATVELDETVQLTLANGSNYNVVTATAVTGTIANDDTDVTLAISPSSVTEDGATNLVYTFTRNGVTATPLTVNFNVSGTATYNTDYTVTGADTFNSSSGTVTFAANSTTATVIIDPTADATVELDETVQLTLANGSNYNVVTATAVTGTIANDDATVEFSQANYQINEDGTVIGATVTINRTGDALSPGSVNVQFTNGTATGGTDFTNTTQTINFAANETSKTVTIPINNDTLYEGNENLTLTLANPSANFVLGTQRTATLTIVDNDLPTVNIAAGLNPAEFATSNGTFTITLDGPAPAGGLTVNFARSGTATNTTDYTITAGSNITTVTGSSFAIAAGVTSATIQVTPVDDAVVDPSETVQLTLNNGSGYNVGAANNASVTITDNDPVISITNGTAPSESGPTNGIFNISLNAASPTPITVNFDTTGSTATATTDYTFDLAASTGITAIAANSFTIAAGVTNATLVVKPVDDALIETGGETVQLNLLSGTGYTLNNATATTTFTPATNFSVGSRPRSVAIGDFNGDGKSDIAVANFSSKNVSILTGTGTGSFNTPTNFSVGSLPNSVAIGDFNGDGKSDIAVTNFSSNNVSILINDGTGSFNTATNFSVGTGPTSVAIGDFNGDGKSDIAVANRDFSNVSILTGTGTGSFNTPTNFSVGIGPFSVAISDFNGDGKSDLAVANSNPKNVSILINDGTGSFNTATNFSVGTGPTSVAIGDFNGDGKSDIAVANSNSNNVSILTGTGTGSFNTPTNFSVGTRPYSVALSDFNGDGKSDIAVANFLSNNVSVLLNQQILSVTQTIADNDPVTVQFSAATYQINEDGTPVAAVTINRSGDALSPGSVQVQLTNGTATGGTDFNNSPITVNFASGETSKTVPIPITDDTLVEGDENLTLTLVNPSPNFVLGTQTTSSVTIVDNDVDVTLAVSPTSVTEDGATNLVYTFTRNGVTTTPLTVNFNVSGTATYNTDYTVTGANTFNGSTGTVTFAANSTTATVTIDPTADTAVELDETVQLTLANGSNYNVVTATAVTGTIANDDAAVEFSQANYQINEDGSIIGATVTINRTGFTNSTGSVDVQFSNGTATGGTDFTNTTQTINFAANETSKTVTIPINDDTLNEGIENFTISLANPSSGISLGSQTTATVQIIDNDAPPSLAVSDIGQLEGNNGTTNLAFTVSLNAASGQTVTVNYTTQNSSATTADNDYSSTSGTLTFNPGNTQKTVTVAVNGDTKYETDETFEVKLSGAVNATIADDTGVGEIQNDDRLPTISISNPSSQNEGNSGTVTHTFNVTLSNPSYQTISVNYNTVDGTATVADGDYNSASGNLVFNPGETQKTFTVTSNGDNKYESNETFAVNISNPNNATLANTQAVVTLNNDDNIPQVSINDVTVTEGTGGTRNAEFTISLSAPSSQTITVNYATSDGTAKDRDDYTAVSATSIVFNPGETSKTISVALNPDSIQEPTETFNVNLTSATNATIADNQGIATINDDDNPVSISISNVSVTEGTGGTINAVITVSLSGVSGLPVTVNYATADGIAKAGSDYTAIASTLLTFNPGETSKTITVEVNPDGIQELAETFNVSLTGATNANFSNNFATVTIINDDRPTQVVDDCFCDRLVHPNIDSISGLDNAANIVTTANSGSDLNDTLIGTNANDQLNGFGGNDWISGLQGNDNIIGGTENDTIYGGQGRDWILGEAGNDWINGNKGDDWINSGLSNDTVYAGQGNDFARGGQNDDLMFGDNGDDTLGGDKGNDTLYGGTDNGRDLLFGGAGNDFLSGNQGNDTLVGDDGNDTIRCGQNDDIAFGDAGDDVLFGDKGNDSLCGEDGNDTLYGGIGNNIASSDEQDYLCGGKGNDLLFGNEGRDNLNGSEGDDTLYGGKEDDILTGGAGTDWLFGDLGQDQLRGGQARDFFALAKGQGTDVILDFTAGEDVLVLRGGLTFAQLSLIDSNGSVLIGLQNSNEILAILPGVQASVLGQFDFIAVV